MLSFEVKEETLPVIKVNFEEMKQALQQTIDKYTGLVVTEEQLSLCKADQKELAGIRNKIDTYRKSKKKELSKPITVFDNQCKELTGMVEKAEAPIKQGIKVFDDKKREEKRQKAQEYINQVIQEHELKEKYATKLTVSAKYLNLSASFKSTKDDIDQRCFVLVEEQKKEEELLQAIQQTIDNANKDIKTPIQLKDVQYLINSGASLPDIISRINHLKEKIKLAEMPKPEPPKEEVKPEPIQQSTVKQETPIQRDAQSVQEEHIYFVDFRIEGTRFDTAKMGQFLRDNKIKYNVLDKGVVK